MTSPFSLYSPVCATETGWWPLEATGHQGRNVRSPAGWRVASGGCWHPKCTLWFSGLWKFEEGEKKSYLCRSPDRMTSDRDSRKHTCSHTSSSSFRSPSVLPFILLHLSIPPLHQLLSSYSSSSSWFVFSRSVSFRLVLGSQPRQGGGLVCWGDSGWFDCCVLIITRIMKGS